MYCLPKTSLLASALELGPISSLRLQTARVAFGTLSSPCRSLTPRGRTLYLRGHAMLPSHVLPLRDALPSGGSIVLQSFQARFEHGLLPGAPPGTPEALDSALPSRQIFEGQTDPARGGP